MFNKLKKIFFAITIIPFILFLLVFYWKYPFKNQENNLTQLKYEEIVNKLNTEHPINLHAAENFIIQNKNIYGTLMALNLAKKYILNDNLDKAFIQLNNSLNYTQEENLKNILKLRMAKLKIQKNQNQYAMNIINSIQDNNWMNIVDNMKGDIFSKKNNSKLAIKFWSKSLSIEESNASKEIIKMKMNGLKN